MILTAKILMQRNTAFLPCMPSNASRAALRLCGTGRIGPDPSELGRGAGVSQAPTGLGTTRLYLPVINTRLSAGA